MSGRSKGEIKGLLEDVPRHINIIIYKHSRNFQAYSNSLVWGSLRLAPIIWILGTYYVLIYSGVSCGIMYATSCKRGSPAE